MYTVKKKRLINPHRKTKKAAVRRTNKTRARRAKRTAPKVNPALATLGYLNPTRSTVKKSKKRKQNHSKTARRRNPLIIVRKAKQQRRRRHSNPSGGLLSRPITMAKTGALALAGLVAARQIPQLILKEKNTGVVGYLSNGATALVTALVASKAAGKEAGQAVLIGGSLYVVSRILAEKLSPVGNLLSLSGIGDATAAASLGKVVPAYYPTPVVYDQSGKPIIPNAIIDATRAALAPPAATNSATVGRIAGVGRLASRF
jgi:hypothetical protein